MSGDPQVGWPALFPEDEIPRIIQDVLDACNDLKRPEKKVKRHEEALSRQVYTKLRNLPIYRRGPIEPHWESWLPDLDSRADIRFTCGKGVDTYFLIEAKRLFVTYPKGKQDTLVKTYIHEGMMRFVEGRYAPFQGTSAMLGYVHDSSIDNARMTLSEEIAVECDILGLIGRFVSSNISVHPKVDETEHLLVNGRKFKIYHLLVKVEEDK